MIEQMTPTEFVQRRAAGDNLLLLDVREPHELAQSSVNGALNIPMAQIPGRLAELDRDRPIAVLCHSGSRSQAVAGFLLQQGFGQVANLAGGIVRWKQEVDPALAL
jgi:adenylyltransferase/sulfurtransferase